MPGPNELPLHPALIHFPIAGTVFAVAALAIATLRPSGRAASLTASILLLSAAIAGALAAATTGWLWADKLAYLAGGWGPIPGPKAIEGLARRHALLAYSFVAAAVTALVLAIRARRRGGSPVPALLAALVAAGLVLAAGHAGGTMVHAPPLPDEEPAKVSPK